MYQRIILAAMETISLAVRSTGRIARVLLPRSYD